MLLVAPRMAGTSARARYLAGKGFWACVGVEADRSGRAQQRMLGLADALGALRTGAVEMTANEATLDLFVEQTVGPLSAPRSWPPSRSAARRGSRPRRW